MNKIIYIIASITLGVAFGKIYALENRLNAYEQVLPHILAEMDEVQENNEDNRVISGLLIEHLQKEQKVVKKLKGM